MEEIKKDNNKFPSYRIAHCGIFPNYFLNNVSFKDKALIYLVSVGKEKFEGPWVERFVNFLKEVKPNKVVIVVADTLQRFNIEIDEGLSSVEAEEQSKIRGKAWVDKYKPYFLDLDSISCEFILGYLKKGSRF